MKTLWPSCGILYYKARFSPKSLKKQYFDSPVFTAQPGVTINW